MSGNVRIGGPGAEAVNARLGAWLPVVGGPCDGQLIRNLRGAPRQAVLFRPHESPVSDLGHDYRWNGSSYVPDVGESQ